MTGERALSLLEETPPRIAVVTAGLTAAELRTAPGPDAWSAIDVLAHLRSFADVWGSAIGATVGSEQPTTRAVNPRTWIKRTDYHELEYADAWRLCVRQRDQLLVQLRPLPAEGWMWVATVTGAGAPLQPSFLSIRQYTPCTRRGWRAMRRPRCSSSRGSTAACVGGDGRGRGAFHPAGQAGQSERQRCPAAVGSEAGRARHVERIDSALCAPQPSGQGRQAPEPAVSAVREPAEA